MSDSDQSNIIIDLLRHGEPEGGKRFRGHGIDDPLSEKGWQQMWDAVEGHSPWQQIISSPMQRCQEFANALSGRHNIPVKTEPGLKEVGFGAWEGLTRTELKQSRLEEYKAFYVDPINNRPQGAEPFNCFVERVAVVYNQILQTPDCKHVLVVAHAGVIRAALIHALNKEPAEMYKTPIDNASISRIRHHSQGVHSEFVNNSLKGSEPF